MKFAAVLSGFLFIFLCYANIPIALIYVIYEWGLGGLSVDLALWSAVKLWVFLLMVMTVLFLVVFFGDR